MEAAAAQPGSSEALDAEEARSNWQALKEELAEQVMHVRTPRMIPRLSRYVAAVR